MEYRYLQDLKNILKITNDEVLLLPFSSERRIYSDNIWSEIENYII